MYVIYLRAIILCVSFFSSAVFSAEIVDGRVESISDSEIRISGMITPNVALKFQNLLDSKVKLVSLSSEGGVTESAMDIAESIQRHGIAIKVLDFCVSSCANYLFVAGSRREVLPSAIVGWHGGHSFKPFRPTIDTGARLVEKEKLLLREQILYARARVSLDLIIYSGILTLGQTGAASVQRDYTLWVPSAEELRRLGVDNLEMSGENREAANIISHLNQAGFRGQRVYTGKAYSFIPDFLLR